MASIESLQLQERRAREDSTLYGWRDVSDRPSWLNEVRAQNINANQPKRLEIKHNNVPWNTSETNVMGTHRKAVGRKIRSLLNANRMSAYHMKPHVDAWYTDEETYKYGEMWEEYDEEMMALRCYLKEEILEKEKMSGKSGKSGKDDIKSMFETEENLQERLAFNEKWNNQNKRISKFAKLDSLQSTKARQKSYAKHVEANQNEAQRKLFDEVKGYLVNQMIIDEQLGEDFDEKIDLALENPVLHNFAVDERSEVVRRAVPFNSNVDEEYEKEQSGILKDMEKKEEEEKSTEDDEK